MEPSSTVFDLIALSVHQRGDSIGVLHQLGIVVLDDRGDIVLHGSALREDGPNISRPVKRDLDGALYVLALLGG